MKKTLVVLETPDGLFSLMHSDLARPPVEGAMYVIDGKAYQVIGIIECLTGKKGSTNGDEKLLSVLSVLADVYAEKAGPLVAGMKSIGSDTKQAAGGGGAIISSVLAGTTKQVTHVLLVRLTQIKNLAPVKKQLRTK